MIIFIRWFIVVFCMPFLIYKLMISLILIGVISLIVIAGTIFLFINKHQELDQPKKSKILLIVGIVIFISFIVTTFKHRNISFSSNVQNHSSINLEDIFFNCNIVSNQKYKGKISIPMEHIDQIYSKNYRQFNLIGSKSQDVSYFQENYQENIMYLSEKDAGSSFFLAHLATNLCKNHKNPVLYLKMSQNIKSEGQFLQMIGMPSFDMFEKSLCYYSGIEISRQQQNSQYTSKSGNYKKPYIIIDNYEHLLDILHTNIIYRNDQQEKDQSEAQYLGKNIKRVNKQRLMGTILDLITKCRVNVILNTQSKDSAQRLYEIWQQYLQMNKMMDKNHKYSSFPFQFHLWQGFRHYDIYKIITKIIPGSDSTVSKFLQLNKRQKYDFRELYSLIDKVQESLKVEKGGKSGSGNVEDKSWRQLSMKMHVAEYFKLGNIFETLRNSQNKKISHLKKLMNLNQLYKLEQIGLVKIQQGTILLK